MKKKNDKIQKYTTLYMSIGMCLGVAGGLIYGNLLFPGNMSMGMTMGLPIGMCLGIAIGAAKDKRLSEKMMELIRMENIPDSSDRMIYAQLKDGEVRSYRVTEKQCKEEKFAVGDRIAEEKDGVIVSLESK